MTENTFKIQSTLATQSLALQAGSLRDFDTSSREFINLTTQYCELVNADSKIYKDSEERLFGTVRLQLKLMPNMDVAFFAYEDPSNKVCGKTIQSAATTLRHDSLALQIKNLSGQSGHKLITELMLTAKNAGLKYMILDLPSSQLPFAMSDLGLEAVSGELNSPLIIKLDGDSPQVVNKIDFLKEPGALEIEFCQSLISQAMRRVKTSIADSDFILNQIYESKYNRRSGQG